jgi:hypothetical protein
VSDDDRRQRFVDVMRDSVEIAPPRPDVTSSPTSSRPRPKVTSSLVPPPSGGDEDEHLVPDLVPTTSSWVPIDLVQRSEKPPEPPAIVDLFYPGYNHLLTGEPESLKTWLALAAAVEEMKAGRGVVWVDGDDVGPGAVLERLRLLGAEDAAISERLAYFLPDDPLDVACRQGVLDLIRDRSCRLAVFDGFNPLLHLHGLDPNKGPEVETFYVLLAPIKRAGVAVVIADNVTKSRETRGAWPIGSERKKSKAEVHLGMSAIHPLVRGGTGKARIDVHKDRPGFLTRPTHGLFVVDATGERCVWSVEQETSRTEEGGFRPTVLMERVSRFLEVAGEPRSRNEIEKGVGKKATYVRQAIDVLVAEGHADEFEGTRNARMVRLLRSYRKDEEEEVERLADRARAMQEADG